jgi:serine/threonine kinase PknH
MALFLSYSSQDRSTVDALASALRRAQQQVWFDQELGGGDSWWAKILEQIRASDVFIVALSSNWLQSKPSQSELRYAQALNRPILPVRIGDIDSMRVNPLAALQIIDYRNPTVDAGIQLVTAVHSLTAKPQPLPDPLPEEPPVPFGYITRLGNTLAEKELSPQQQLQLLVELRSGLDEDGDDPSARSDIAQLLRMLRLRHDVTYRTRNDIDNVLASIEATDGKAEAKATPAPATQKSPTPAAGAVPSTARSATAVATPGGSNRRLIIIGGATMAVIAAIAVVVVLAMGGKSKPAPKAGTASQAGPAMTANPGNPANPPTGATMLDSYLLGAPDIGTIVSAPSLVVSDKAVQLRTPRGSLSNPDCLGAYEPIEEAVYQPSGYTAVSGQAVHDAEPDSAHRVFESVVQFPSAEKAGAFVQASEDKWKACAAQQVTTTFNGKTQAWTFGQLAGAAPRIAQERVQADGARTCHHVLHAVSDVVIDVLVCGADAAPGQAGKIAEQIAAKIGR